MPKAYWIARISVSDPDQYEEYKKLSGPAVTANGGRILARGGKAKTVEGIGRSRNVIIEFPSFEAALKAYESPEYHKARAARIGAADFDLTIVEGVE